MNIAFLGLGGMGGGMARNLIKHGHSVIAWNRSPEPAAALHTEGARIAATPAEAASGAEIAMTMLANDEAVESVTLGANGLAEGLAKGAAHVSMSTISVRCPSTSPRLMRHEVSGWPQRPCSAGLIKRRRASSLSPWAAPPMWWNGSVRHWTRWGSEAL